MRILQVSKEFSLTNWLTPLVLSILIVAPIHQASGAAAAGPLTAVTVPDIAHNVLALGPPVQQLFLEIALELGSVAPQLALV